MLLLLYCVIEFKCCFQLLRTDQTISVFPYCISIKHNHSAFPHLTLCVSSEVCPLHKVQPPAPLTQHFMVTHISSTHLKATVLGTVRGIHKYPHSTLSSPSTCARFAAVWILVHNHLSNVPRCHCNTCRAEARNRSTASFPSRPPE